MNAPAPRYHDRTDKVRSRKGRMPVHGRALKRLLIDRAAKAQAHKPKAK